MTSAAKSSNVSSAAKAGIGQIGTSAAVSIGIDGMVGAGIVIAAASFTAEWAYRRSTGRKIKEEI